MTPEEHLRRLRRLSAIGTFVGLVLMAGLFAYIAWVIGLL